MTRGVGGTPGDGPYIVLHLDVLEGVFGEGSFECNGCPPAQHAACAALAVARGRSVSQLALLEPRDLELLGGALPEGKGFYYELAVQALRGCIAAAETPAGAPEQK